MTAYVYVIAAQGARGRLTYVGWTLDLARRLAEHNGGKAGAKSTRGRQWDLLYAEKCPDRIAAMRREVFLKRDRALRRKIAHWL